jgi:hypothetical protein
MSRLKFIIGFATAIITLVVALLGLGQKISATDDNSRAPKEQRATTKDTYIDQKGTVCPTVNIGNQNTSSTNCTTPPNLSGNPEKK